MRPLPFPLFPHRFSRWLSYRLTRCAVAPHFVSTIAHAQALVGLLVNRYSAPSQAGPPLRFLDLQHSLIHTYCVVSPNYPFVLDRKDQSQILPFDFRKGAATLLASHCKLAVELTDVARLQKLVRRLDCCNPSQAQLLRQPPLPSPGTAL